MMKLHILSDLHTEFADFVPPETDADVVILAGDIGVGLCGIKWAAEYFPSAPVIYVPGNHEYYGHDITLIEGLVAQSAANIQVLNDDKAVIDGIRFLGSTLWTDFQLFGEGNARVSCQHATQWLTDFKVIKYRGCAFTPEDSVELHEASRAWLDRELGTPFDGPTVVVTHHLPASMSVARRYTNDALSPAFASRLENLIEKYHPELWIHGHTHVPCDYELVDTRIVCNPRGYPQENLDSAFDPGLVVELPA